MGAVRLDTREKRRQRKLMNARRLRPSGGSVARSVPSLSFCLARGPRPLDTRLNATHRPHCVWKPCPRSVLPFRRDGDHPGGRPCDDHNKGQDLFGHHSPPVDHRTLQAFYLHDPSEPEATWGDDHLLRDGEENVTSPAEWIPFLHGNVHSDRRGGAHLYNGRLYDGHPGSDLHDTPGDHHDDSYQGRATKGNKSTSLCLVLKNSHHQISPREQADHGGPCHLDP